MRFLKQFWQIGLFFFKDSTAFRLNFVFGKLREVVGLLTIFIFWQAVLNYGVTFGNYSGAGMLSYFIYSFLVGQVVLSTRLFTIGNSIISGEFSRLLLYPASLFKLFTAWEVVDKLINLAISLIYIIPLGFLVRAYLPRLGLVDGLVFGAFLLTSVAVFTMLVMIINSLAFYTNQLWAINFLFFILLSFFSGQYFPLDLLGVWATLTPFAFVNYWPARLLLGQVGFVNLWLALGVGWLWVVILYQVYRLAWATGRRRFTGWGA